MTHSYLATKNVAWEKHTIFGSLCSKTYVFVAATSPYVFEHILPNIVCFSHATFQYYANFSITKLDMDILRSDLGSGDSYLPFSPKCGVGKTYYIW